MGDNPAGGVDPLGSWTLTIGEGIGWGDLTIGYNGGQWSVGGFVGVGEGLFGGYDPMDSGAGQPGIEAAAT